MIGGSRIASAVAIIAVLTAFILLDTGIASAVPMVPVPERARAIGAREGYLQRVEGTRICSFVATAQPGLPSSFPKWWTPTPFLSPTWDVMVTSDTSAGGTWDVVKRCSLRTMDRYPLELHTRFRKYLRSTSRIQAADPSLKALAATLTATCTWESDAVERLLTWLFANVRYDDGLSGSQDALSVYKRKTGTCVGYSNLAVALLRAAGIPADVVDGWLQYDYPATAASKSIGARGLYEDGHEWISVLYPSAGWVMSEPQGWINVIETPYVITPSETWFWMANLLRPGLPLGVAVSSRTDSQTTTGIETFTTPDGRYAAGEAATVIHEPPASEGTPAVHLETYPGEVATFTTTIRPPVRTWVANSHSIVWCTVARDGSVVASGAPSLLAYDWGSAFANPWAISDGRHSLTVTVEDASGTTSWARLPVVTRYRAILSPPRVPRAAYSGRRFMIRGGITPAHRSRALVRVHFYYRSGEGWKWQKQTSIYVERGATYYRGLCTIYRRGRWLARAMHADDIHPTSWSKGSTFFVR